MTLQQTVDSQIILKYLDNASHKGYDSGPSFTRHVIEDRKDRFFVDSSGRRYIWGFDINYFHDWLYYGKHLKLVTDRGHRHYLLPYGRPTLATIDRPTSKAVVKSMTHTSESGWALPVDHPRHFNKLPLDIKVMIVELVLMIPTQQVIEPHVVKSNMKRNWSMPHYRTYDGNTLEESTTFEIVQFQRRDREGAYTELRKFTRKVMDACLLRASSEFYLGFSGILYGCNTFKFSVPTPGFDNCPATMLPRDRELWRPRPSCPPLNKGQWLPRVRKVIKQIQDQCHILSLDGWAYYSPFLRFLHSIGPRNASFLKSIELHGNVKDHVCSRDYCGFKCPHDLVHTLRLYCHVITAICPRLEKVVLCLGRPDGSNREIVKKALKPLLEEDLRQIPSLLQLEVLDSDSTAGPRLRFADPAVQWFCDKRKQHALDTALTATNVDSLRTIFGEEGCVGKTGSSNTPLDSRQNCYFCKEDHSWVECTNLCPFCGEYGHMRKGCEAFQKVLDKTKVSRERTEAKEAKARGRSS